MGNLLQNLEMKETKETNINLYYMKLKASKNPYYKNRTKY